MYVSHLTRLGLMNREYPPPLLMTVCEILPEFQLLIEIGAEFRLTELPLMLFSEILPNEGVSI